MVPGNEVELLVLQVKKERASVNLTWFHLPEFISKLSVSKFVNNCKWVIKPCGNGVHSLGNVE